jgi:hypothetical protein
MITRREDLVRWVSRVRTLTRDIGERSSLTRADRVASAIDQGKRRDERQQRHIQEIDHYLAAVEQSLERDAQEEEKS